MTTRSADDFETIRARLEQLKKEREEVDKATAETQPALPLADDTNDYYGCGANLTIAEKMQLQLSEAPIGFKYEDYELDEDDNIKIMSDDEYKEWQAKKITPILFRVMPGL